MGLPLIWDESVADFSKWVDFRRPDLAPGTAWWRRDSEGKVHAISYICPCGCSDWRQVSVQVGEGRGWNWNSDEERPTLTPSLQHNPGMPEKCQWHGFLTAGEWLTC